MTTPEFDEAYNRLNPAQKQAVDTIDGSVMVVAGPGTGKTQILTLRIANILLTTDINPENILALTFTESAVYQMRKRLVSIMGTPGYRVQIYTFHGFANEIIQQNPENFPNLISAQPASDLEQIEIMEQILTETPLALLKPFGDPMFYVKPALNAINELKKEGVSPQQFSQALRKQKVEFDTIDDLYYEKGPNKGRMKGKYQDLKRDIAKNEELLIIYNKYQESLKEKKLYDFNDMLLEVITAFSNDQDFLLRLQEKIQYVLVDEHQDTNAAQNKIVELLCSFYENPNLFVVGDEKQAIYRFQGASLENFLYFKSLYPDAVLINLTENYRSTQTVLSGAGSMITKNVITNVLFPDQVELHSNVEFPEELIKIVELSDYHAEYLFLADDIKTKIDNGVTPSEIAVLARNNRDLLPLKDILESKSIPFVLESDQNVLSDPYIQKIILLLQAVNEVAKDGYFIRAMHLNFLNINPLDIYKLMRYAQVNETTVVDTLNDEKINEKIGLKSYPEIMSFYNQILYWNKMGFNENLACVYVSVLKESGLLETIINAPNSIDVLDKFASLYEDIKTQMERKPGFSLQDFLNYLDLVQTHQIAIRKNRRSSQKSAVRLMTAHRSKGLEFEYVYIINTYDGHWGNQRKKSNYFSIPWEFLGVNTTATLQVDDNEDERRLFYVALTRAKKEITMTYSTFSIEGKEQSPSLLVEEIGDSFKQKIEVKEFEENYKNNKEIIFISQPLEQSTNKNDFLESKDFFSELFIERGLSATGLNNYLECPWRFIFSNLLQIPEVKSKSMIFGSAVHAALSEYLKTPNNKQDEKIVIDHYLNVLKKEYLTKIDRLELENKGKTTLKGFYENVMVHWSGKRLSEMAVRGIKIGEGIKLNGVIDMIDLTDNKGTVIVHDFKTGRSKTRRTLEGLTLSSTGNYKRQLVFYKLLLDHYHNGKMKMTEGVIDFVEPDKSGKYRSESFAIEPQEVKELEQLILNVADEIITLSFWDRRCDKQGCEYCALRDYIL